MLKKNKSWPIINQLFCLYALYFSLYLYIYVHYIVDIFGYMGYVDDFSPIKMIVALMGIATCLLSIRKGTKPTIFFSHIALGMIIIPTMVIFCGGNLPYFFFLVSVTSFLVVALTARYVRLSRIRLAKIRSHHFLKTMLFIALAYIVVIFLLGGGSYFNFDLTVIYEMREEVDENLPAVFAYISPPMAKVIIPFGIAISLMTQKSKYLIAFLVCALLLFGLTANKSVILLSLAVIFFYYISGKNNLIILFLLAAIFIGLFSLAEFYYFQDTPEYSYWFSSIFLRRAFLVPSLLNWFTIDWFTTQNFYFWANSKISFGLINPPSYLSIPNLIGGEYLNNPEASANVGWIGSGFGNLGILGSIIYSFLLGLLMSLLDVYAKVFGIRFVITASAALMLSIVTSTDLLTSIFTHGLFYMLIFLSLLSPGHDN